MEKFEREHRYLVLKISDINAICTDEIKGRLEDIALMVERGRAYQGKPSLTCVVVESDWPEYEPTWKAIEQRMTSAPQSEQTHVRVPVEVFAYSCANEVAGLKPCKHWCGNMKKCVAKLEEK